MILMMMMMKINDGGGGGGGNDKEEDNDNSKNNDSNIINFNGKKEGEDDITVDFYNSVNMMVFFADSNSNSVKLMMLLR